MKKLISMQLDKISAGVITISIPGLKNGISVGTETNLKNFSANRIVPGLQAGVQNLIQNIKSAPIVNLNSLLAQFNLKTR